MTHLIKGDFIKELPQGLFNLACTLYKWGARNNAATHFPFYFKEDFDHLHQWQIDFHSLQSTARELSGVWTEKTYSLGRQPLSDMNYYLCSGKKWGWLPVPNSSGCPNTIAQPAPAQARHLLSGISWCRAQHLIHSGVALIPWAFYQQTSGWILALRTCMSPAFAPWMFAPLWSSLLCSLVTEQCEPLFFHSSWVKKKFQAQTCWSLI